MTSYYLPPNAKEGTLRSKIEQQQGKLQALNISNCIVANPEDLLRYISGLQNLKILKSVACPLSASFLLGSLLTSLENVTHLDFSLVDSKEDAELELIKVRHIARVTSEHRNQETKLRKVFVEVAGEHNLQVLSIFVGYCPHVTDLHIHIAHFARPDVDVATCVRIAEGLQSLEAFTLTCEALLPSRPEPDRPLDLQYCAGIHGNVVYRKNLTSLNYALLSGLSRSSIPVFPSDPNVLVAFDTPDFVAQLHDACSHHKWSQLRRLCIVLFPQCLDDTVYPAVGAAHNIALRNFFARFSSLCELNVSSFHFGDDIDFMELLATPALQRLRALCLPPCGMRQSGAMTRVYATISDIEDLDIRLNVGGRHQRCDSCNKPLLFETTYNSVFRVRMGQGRFTLCNVPYLASLDFLRNCRVPQLRFIDVDDVPRFGYFPLARALCAELNVFLRSLVVKFENIALDDSSLMSCLYNAVFLERLCLLSNTQLPSYYAKEKIRAMAAQKPSISYLHMHYVDGAGKEARLTWIRLLGQVARNSQHGKVMAGKPCIMCSTQTFTALSKPRRREL